jgi:general nucleoside transport system permease protein
MTSCTKQFIPTLSSVGAAVGALILAGLLMLALGVNPLTAYVAMINGAFGNAQNLSDTIVKTIPIALIALGVALTFKCGLWNAGGEGQLYFGAIAAVIIGIELDAPAVVVVLAEFTGGLAAGALAGLLPGILKVRFGANEILVTLMLNFIAILLAGYIIHVAYTATFTPSTINISQAAELPWLNSHGLRIHIGAVFAVIATILMYILMTRTTFGYRVRAIGSNIDAARNAGINVARTLLISFVIAGSLGGLAGMVQIAAVNHNLLDSFSPGFGYTAIVAALLGRLHPIGALISSFAFSALLVGGQAMQRSEGIQFSLVFVIQGLILIFLLAAKVVGRESTRVT